MSNNTISAGSLVKINQTKEWKSFYNFPNFVVMFSQEYADTMHYRQVALNTPQSSGLWIMGKRAAESKDHAEYYLEVLSPGGIISAIVNRKDVTVLA
jgi:hypothetical protein